MATPTSGVMPGMTLPDMADQTPTKPACGTTGPKQEYDLPLHVAALWFPVVAKKFRSLRIPPKVFFFCKHFGTGVLIATAFVHLLPTAFQSLNNPCLPDLFTNDYPALPGVIGLGSMFMLFVIEMWMHTKMPHAHSHSSATGEEFAGGHVATPPSDHAPAARALPNVQPPMQSNLKGDFAFLDEKRSSFVVEEFGYSNRKQAPDLTSTSEMPVWFIAFYEQYVRQRDEMLQMVKRYAPALPQYSRETNVKDSMFDDDSDTASNEELKSPNGLVDLEHGTVDPMVYKKMSMEITLLEGGILFHSVFVGMTVSITIDGFIVLLIAILFHQTFEGLGLGSRIAAVPYPRGSFKPWLLVFAFGTTAPIGQAIGLITRNSYDPNSAFALILVGFFNAFSSGLLIYAGLVDLLHADFLSEEADRVLSNKQKMQAFGFVLMGAAGMSIVGAFA